MNHAQKDPGFSLRRDVLAIHVVKRLTIAQTEGHLLSLQDLADELGVRKTDVRDIISVLHAQGYVDALRMRPTLAGFAIGSATSDAELAPIRKAVRVALVAA